MKLEFSQQIFGKKFQYNFIKIRPVGAELFNAAPCPLCSEDRQLFAPQHGYVYTGLHVTTSV